MAYGRDSTLLKEVKWRLTKLNQFGRHRDKELTGFRSVARGGGHGMTRNGFLGPHAAYAALLMLCSTSLSAGCPRVSALGFFFRPSHETGAYSLNYTTVVRTQVPCAVS